MRPGPPPKRQPKIEIEKITYNNDRVEYSVVVRSKSGLPIPSMCNSFTNYDEASRFAEEAYAKVIDKTILKKETVLTIGGPVDGGEGEEIKPKRKFLWL